MIYTYYYFGANSESYLKHNKALTKLELFKYETDPKYIYYIINHSKITYWIKNYYKITYNSENNQLNILCPWVKKQENLEKRIDLDLNLNINESNIPEFILFNLSKFQGYKWNTNDNFIIESKLQEYETKFNEIFNTVKNKILSEFEQMKKEKKLFRYIIVRDNDGEMYDLEEKYNSEEKISNSDTYNKQIEEFNLIHKLILKYNYVSALVQFDKIEFEEEKYTIKTIVTKCKNVLDKKQIKQRFLMENPDAKYEQTGKLTQEQYLKFDFYPWYHYNGFENISTQRFSVHHIISDDVYGVNIFLMENGLYQNKFKEWVQKYFHEM